MAVIAYLRQSRIRRPTTAWSEPRALSAGYTPVSFAAAACRAEYPHGVLHCVRSDAASALAHVRRCGDLRRGPPDSHGPFRAPKPACLRRSKAPSTGCLSNSRTRRAPPGADPGPDTGMDGGRPLTVE